MISQSTHDWYCKQLTYFRIAYFKLGYLDIYRDYKVNTPVFPEEGAFRPYRSEPSDEQAGDEAEWWETIYQSNDYPEFPTRMF